MDIIQRALHVFGANHLGFWFERGEEDVAAAGHAGYVEDQRRSGRGERCVGLWWGLVSDGGQGGQRGGFHSHGSAGVGHLFIYTSSGEAGVATYRMRMSTRRQAYCR